MRYGEMVEAAPPTESGGYGGSGQAPSGNNSSWGPFRSATNYGANMAVVMGILFSAFVLGLLLMAAARFLFRRLCRTPPEGHPGKAVTAAVSSSGAGGPPTVYAAGETELVGSAAVCAICLSEFADGDAVRVLPPCRHGFHAECVEGWWASSSSAATARSKPLHRNAPPCCPVCRAIICQSSPAPETEHGTRPRS